MIEKIDELYKAASERNIRLLSVEIVASDFKKLLRETNNLFQRRVSVFVTVAWSLCIKDVYAELTRIKMKKKKLYLSGPMTGIKDLNVPAFNKAAKKLRAKGYVVINPPELDRRDKRYTWEECLKRDLQYVVECDEIATLPNCKKSRGANLEIYVGRAVRMPVHPVAYYLR